MKIDARDVYEKALEKVKMYTGLRDLTNIEKFGLLVISRDALKRCLRSRQPYDEFPPVSEAAAVFLIRYYGLYASRDKDLVFLEHLKMLGKKRKGYDALGEYFQLEQDRRHMP